MGRSESDIIHRTRVAVISLVALLMFGLVGGVVTWRIRLSQAVDGQLAALRAAGLPTSGAELNQWYPSVPDSENAARVLTQAFALMRTFPDLRSNEVARFKPPPRGQPLNPDQVQLLSDYVNLNAAALETAARAVKLPKSRYPVDWTPDFLALLPHLGQLRSLAHAASFEAILAIDSKKNADAARSIVLLIRLAGTLDDEPEVNSQQARGAIIRMATSALEASLRAGELSEADSDSLGLLLAMAQRTNLLMRAFIGERALSIPYFRTKKAEAEEILRSTPDIDPDAEASIDPVLLEPLQLWRRATGGFERDLRFYLGAMSNNIAVASLPLPRNPGITKLVAQDRDDALGHRYYFSAMLLPDVDRLLRREVECSAHLNLAQSAVAVERFRLATGRIPTDLVELVPRFLAVPPVDPFDGAPLRYRQLSKGYLIYSVGPDGHDDNGKEPPATRRAADRGPEDITFTVER